MTNILIVFPKLENGRSIKSILVRNGYAVTAVCTTGAQALTYIEEWDSGIVLCGYALPDMIYWELHAYLRPEFQMLVITGPQHCGEHSADNLLYLPMPFKANEVLSTVEMMEQARIRRKRKLRQQPKVRNEEELQTISQAKKLLMERNHLTEAEAHRYLQKTSMDSGTNLVETAQMVLSVMMEG